MPLAKELEQSYPTNTMLKVYRLPTILAAVDVNKYNARQAVRDLKAAASYDLAEADAFIAYLYPAFVRGPAYLLTHKRIRERPQLLSSRSCLITPESCGTV